MADSLANPSDDTLNALENSVQKAQTGEEKAIMHAKLLAYYQTVNLLPASDATTATKERLRKLIIETAPSDKKAAFENQFAQITFNDYTDALKSGASDRAQTIKNQLTDYISKGANVPALEELQKRAGNMSTDGLLNQIKKDGTTLMESLPKNLQETGKEQMNQATTILN